MQTVYGELGLKLSFTEITPADLARIAGYREPFRRRIPQMVTAFYAHLMTIPALVDVVNRFSTVERLKGSLAEYLDWLVRGRVDEEYMTYRLRIGTVHERIGLAPQWYLGMFHVLEHEIVGLIQEQTPSPAEQAEAIGAFLKLLSLDMQLAMESYISAYVAARADLDRITALNQALSNSSQDLAATAEEFSASAEAMTSAAEHVADRSAEVAALTREAQCRATAGAERLKEVAATIRQVEEQMAAMQTQVAALSGFSAQMETILKAVEGVAKQTNLLSLNAAIEAARAGQHGRGFAVVAEEVRRLSDRTSASLKQISELINASRSQVSGVSQTAGAVGKAAAGASGATGQAEGELQGIVGLTADSASQVEEMDEGIRHLAAMAAQVQGGAEQSARLAATLSELAQKNG